MVIGKQLQRVEIGLSLIFIMHQNPEVEKNTENYLELLENRIGVAGFSVFVTKVFEAKAGTGVVILIMVQMKDWSGEEIFYKTQKAM